MQDYNAMRPPRVPDRSYRATLTTIAGTNGTTAVFPAGYPLRQATFAHCRDHLLVRATGHADVVVPRFFGSGEQTTLITGDGMEVSRHMVLVMMNISPRIERVLNELAAPGGCDA